MNEIMGRSRLYRAVPSNIALWGEGNVLCVLFGGLATRHMWLLHIEIYYCDQRTEF